MHDAKRSDPRPASSSYCHGLESRTFERVLRAVFRVYGHDLTGEAAHFQDWRRVDLNGMPEISLVQVKPQVAKTPYVRGAVGHHHHIAFNAESRQAVDDCYALLQRLVHTGAKIIHPPKAYPEYSEGYYAVFFEDPDGLYLEVTYTPSSGKKKPLNPIT